MADEPSGHGLGRRELLLGALGLTLTGCGSRHGSVPVARASSSASPSTARAATSASPAVTPPRGGVRRAASARQILARSHVPVLCFHQIRDWAATDSSGARAIITPPARFARQMRALADAGFRTISPHQLLEYLQYGSKLPARPVLLTFDDASEGQYTYALPVLLRYGFTATFFVMTVVLDKRRWLSRAQVRDLARRGMTIGAHTFDHQPVTGYSGAQWRIQLARPARELARISGRPVRFLAYPYGVWDQKALPHVRQAGYQAAFQLSGRQDQREPLLTIRRIVAPSDWDGRTLLDHIDADFKTR